MLLLFLFPLVAVPASSFMEDLNFLLEGNGKNLPEKLLPRGDGKLTTYAENLPSPTDFSDKLEKNFADQSHTNNAMDIALHQIIKILKLRNTTKIRIPEINEEFLYGPSKFQAYGSFNATDGYFSDLATLNRTSDVIHNLKGLKLSLLCVLNFTKAEILYNDYELEYNHISTNNEFMRADIKGVAIVTNFSLDYSQRPCKAKLENMKMTKFGEVEVYVTGLGPLDLLLPSITTWIQKNWEKYIVGKVETKIRFAIEQQMEKFRCDKFIKF